MTLDTEKPSFRQFPFSVRAASTRLPRIGQAFEKRFWGGPKPTWRPVPAVIWRGYGDALQRTVRRVSRKRAKRLIFGGSGLKAY